MSNYNKATNFAVKDTLTSGDPDKVVSGAEIDNEFNAISSAVNSKADSSELQALAPVPSGGIIMWSGTINSIPIGWSICNGTNGTPDLRERFVVGAGGTYNVDETGGQNSVQLTESQMPSHDHTMSSAGNHTHSGSTDFDPGHTHEYVRALSGNDNDRGTQFSEISVDNQESVQTSTAGAHDHSLNINSNGDHTHNINNAGSDQSHENRPPYYALAFIMKL